MMTDLPDPIKPKAERGERLLRMSTTHPDIFDPEVLLIETLVCLIHFMHRADMNPRLYIEEAISVVAEDHARRVRRRPSPKAAAE